jgi:hypothetical protein
VILDDAAARDGGRSVANPDRRHDLPMPLNRRDLNERLTRSPAAA